MPAWGRQVDAAMRGKDGAACAGGGWQVQGPVIEVRVFKISER